MDALFMALFVGEDAAYDCTAYGLGAGDETAGDIDAENYFDILPPEIKWAIFCNLDYKSALSASAVCRDWRAFFSDELLWKTLSRRDAPTWCAVGNTLYRAPPTKLDLYSSARMRYLVGAHIDATTRAGRVWTPNGGETDSLWSRGVQRVTRWVSRRGANDMRNVLALGPALDSGAQHVVHNLMWSDASPFVTKGLTRGVNGVCAGVYLCRREVNSAGKLIATNFMTLYGAQQSVREMMSRGVAVHTNDDDADPRVPLARLLGNRAERTMSVVGSSLDVIMYMCDATVASDAAQAERCSSVIAAVASYAPPSAKLLVMVFGASAGTALGAGHAAATPDACARALRLESVCATRAWLCVAADTESLGEMAPAMDWALAE